MPRGAKRPRNVSGGFGSFASPRKARRSSTPRRSASRRRRSVVRRRSTSRKIRGDGPGMLVNPGRSRVLVVKKMVPSTYADYTAATTAAAPVDFWFYQFDPTGTTVVGADLNTRLQYSTGIATGAGSLASGSGMPDIAAYRALYQFIKVKYIRITHTLKTRETTDGALFPTIWMRFLYDKNPGSLFTNNNMPAQFAELRGFKKFIFNADDPTSSTISYKIYPRMVMDGFQTSLGTSSSYIKPRWCDIGDPAVHYGFIEGFDAPLPTGMLISTDIEYCVAFKSSR